MSSTPILEPLPKNTPFDVVENRKQTPNPVMQRWFQQVVQFINNLGGNLGQGNGSLANVQARTIGTGSGPTNPNAVVAFRKVEINGVTYWQPLFQ